MTVRPESTVATGPLVTAVLVCWNHERYLRSALLSALNQTYANIEVIVIDNGSIDGSRRELLSLRNEFEFTLVCQDNVGLVKALNQALRIARGKYFTGLATDDIWLPNKTACQVAFLEANPNVALVSGQVNGINSDGRPIDVSSVVREGDATFKDLMAQGCFVYGATAMCQTNTLREIGGYDESLRIEDYSLALKLSYMGRRVVVLPHVFTLYRRHETNWTKGSIDSELEEIGAKYRHTSEYRNFYRYHFPMRFWQLVRVGRKLEAIRLLRDEPVPVTWANLGRGLLRMLVPYWLIRRYRIARGRPPEGEPLA